jgi:hypothetical protein
LTPLPGTPYWNKEEWHGSGEQQREYDFLLHFQGEGLKAKLSRTLLLCYWFSWPKERLKGFLSGLVTRDSRRRSIQLRNAARFNRYMGRAVWNALAGRSEFSMNLPDWYES